MIVRILNSDINKYKMAGVRIHDFTHASWRNDVDIIIKGIGGIVSYITIPKSTDQSQVAEMVDYIKK